MIQESIISKESIITSLEKQINALIFSYENQVNELKSENDNLKNELQLLNREVDSLKEQINQSTMSNSHETETVKTQSDILKTLTSSNQKKSINEQIEQLQIISNQSTYENCLEPLLKINSKLLTSEEHKQLTAFLLEMFNYEFNDLSVMDSTYRVALALINECIDSMEIFSFLRENSNLIMEKVIETNEPGIITELASIYFINNTHDLLGKFLTFIIDQWDFIDSNIEKRDFVRFVWICFFLSKDNKLLEKAGVSGAFLKENDPDISLYHSYYDIINRKIKFDKGAIKIDEYKDKIILLKEEEKRKVLKSIEKRLKKFEKGVMGKAKQLMNSKEKNQQIPRKILFVTKLPNNIPILPGSGKPLQEEWIYLATFKDLHLQKEEGYVLIKALSYKKSGKVYVTQSHIKELRTKIGNRQVNIHGYKQEVKTEVKFSKNEITTSIIINGGDSRENDEKSQFNETSELRMLGYQITGLTRARRWTILEIAVKQLGLKKVSYTIAQNVKLRKGQKNGETKFSYAIAEWEHDLRQLKQKYYRNNFIWPTTNVNA